MSNCGPLFNGHSQLCHSAIGRFQRVTPLIASRAVRNHFGGVRIEARVASSKM